VIGLGAIGLVPFGDWVPMTWASVASSDDDDELLPSLGSISLT